MLAFNPGELLQDRYRVDRLLGEGGMSWVYLAHHVLLEQPVALKVLKPLYLDPVQAQEHIDQLRFEASVMARLDHPYLVRAFDMFMHQQQPVLVLEMVDGRNFEALVKLAPKPIAERRVLRWIAQALDALEYLHGQNPPIIVRDLKPGNIMLARDGRVRLIDFGLAKRMDQQGGGTRAFARGMGSTGYAPLEQYTQASTDARSDLYALGATLYFLLTKSDPPPASHRVADEVPIPDPRLLNPSVSERTWNAIQELMAIRPQGRPVDVRAARELLGLPSPEAASRTLSNQEEQPDRAWSERASGKRCAGCGCLLRAQEKHGVEIDVCRECGGVWLDRGELESLLALADTDESDANSAQDSDRLDSDSLDSDELEGAPRKDRGSSSEGKRKPKKLDKDSKPLWNSGLAKVWQVLKELLD